MEDSLNNLHALYNDLIMIYPISPLHHYSALYTSPYIKSICVESDGMFEMKGHNQRILLQILVRTLTLFLLIWGTTGVIILAYIHLIVAGILSYVQIIIYKYAYVYISKKASKEI